MRGDSFRDESQMGLDPAPHVFIFVHIPQFLSPVEFDRTIVKLNTVTTSNGESLGSCLDDERSQLR